MAKSYKKTKQKSNSNQNISLNDQYQPTPYKKEKLKSSKLYMISCLILFVFFLLMYNSVIDYYMTTSALKNAVSHEYVYANYVEKIKSPLDNIFFAVFYCILFSYILVIWAMSDSYGHSSSGSSGSSNNIIGKIIAGWLMFPFLSIIPVIFLCIIHHHNVDKLMYKNINNLYQIVSKDPKFQQTTMSKSFEKAIQNKDYDKLKELSNNINSLAKVTPEQLHMLEDVVKKISINKIREDFETFKDGYNSYEEYIVFYNKAKKLFNGSEYKNNPKYMEEMKNLKIIGYDYEPIKTLIK